MKKIFLAALVLPLSFFVFSCKSSEAAVTKAQEDSEAVAEQSSSEESAEAVESAEASAAGAELAEAEEAEALAEKIPESEFEEFRPLLEDGESAEEKAKQESEEQSESPSLAEKIRASNSSADEKEESEKLPDGASYTDKMDAGETNSESAPQKSASAESASSDGEESGITRVTSQGQSVKGGPLIGPGSDQVFPGRDASIETPAPSAANAAASASQATNEGIALASPQKEEDEAPQEEEKPEPVPSRAMTIKNNQFVDIVYPGSGWIYLGEEGSGDHFIFQGRKLGNGETTFSLRSKTPGTALLHFYKNDILTGNYIDDYIEISITEKSAADAVHVTAPSYEEVVPPKFDRTKAVEEKSQAQEAAKKPEEKRNEPSSKGAAAAPAQSKEAASAEPQGENTPSEKVQTVIQTSGLEKSESKQKTSVAATKDASAASAAEGGSQKSGGQSESAGAAKASSLLERAQKAYDEKRYADALDLVQQFFDTATDDIDAGLYLEGLILEAKSEVRNIKSAIGAYDTLIKNWPQSRYWRRANERSIYLKRFYIDIR